MFRAESRLAQSRAALIKTEQDVARYTPLVKDQAASQQDLDGSVAQRDVSREEVAARKTELTQTKLTQRRRSPWPRCRTRSSTGQLAPGRAQSGLYRHPRPGGRPYRRVGRLCRHPGDEKLAQASDAAVPLDPIQVKVKIGERDYLNYSRTLSTNEEERKKQLATSFHFQLLLGDGSTYPYPGRFRSGDRAVDPQTGTLEITLDFPNPQATLLPGIFSRVKIKPGRKAACFWCPNGPLRNSRGCAVVYLVGKEGKVETRTVTATERLGNLWAIEKGLAAGDRVIVEEYSGCNPA